MPAREEHIVRKILTAIDDDSELSQRKLSSEMGIAVGSVNWYLKRCVSKGLVKLHQVPVKRYAYFLTLKGFEEKARLTATFLQSSLDLYRRGRKECSGFFRACAESGHTRVFLAGGGDFAEIAVLSSLGTGAEPVAVIDPDDAQGVCAGVPVYDSLAEAIKKAGTPDAILLTHLTEPARAYDRILREALEAALVEELVQIPRVLNFKPREHSHE